jgi:nucleotide-binding universal stress UspA family protein
VRPKVDGAGAVRRGLEEASCSFDEGPPVPCHWALLPCPACDNPGAMNTDAHVVVGYDGKPDSIAALSWAARTASLRGEAVVATTVIDPRETPRGMAWPESYWQEIEVRARQVLAQWPDVPATFERHTGHLVPRLLESAEGASMLVVGSFGHRAFAEMLFGSVSQSAARHSALPVVVVRPPVDPDSGRIVVGADGSEASARALEFACDMAERTGDKVVALRAWHPTTVVADRYGYFPPPSGDSMEAADSALGRTVDDLRDAHPDVPLEGEIFYGNAERALADASSSASLVVVGSRGHNAVGELLVGSVSKAVLLHARCPIAVVH